MIRGEIIAVGTELLLGQIANTNAQYISQRMAEIGLSIYYHTAVGDNIERIMNAVKNAQQRSNLIIFTGGLGPTKDDLTREVVAKLLNKKIIVDEPSYKTIVEFFANRNVRMTENNIKQAMVIENSIVFPNNYGLAIGFSHQNKDRTYIFLPGPPKEMNPMLDDYVIPWLKNKYQKYIFYSKVMRFAGIGESGLEERIIDIIDNQANPTIAPLAKDGEVTLRITAKAKDKNHAETLITPIETKIHERLKKYHFGYGDESLEEVVFSLLKREEKTISTAESCTGGLVGKRLTSISGSSSVYKGGVICYSNHIKNKVLNVPLEVLEQYGAVSEETAKLLADNTRKIFETDYAISITGVAGPKSIEDKPIGLIYVGISIKGKDTVVNKLNLSGNRQVIQDRATKYALYYLWEKITNEE